MRLSTSFSESCSRLTRKSFESITDFLAAHSNLQKQNLHGNDQVELEKKILITLRYLCSQEVLLSLSDRFNVATSTVFDIVEEVRDFNFSPICSQLI